MNTQITQAVADRSVLKFVYDGILRTVEAHAYGVHKDTDSEILIGFQLGGSRHSGDLAGWKVYRISEISHLRCDEDHFQRKPKDTNFLVSQLSQTFADAWNCHHPPLRA